MQVGMQAKTIKKVLREKVDAWLASIEDETVRKAAADNTIVTGGCIASMLLGEKINDFDLYFRSKETAVLVAKYYVARFNPKNKHGIPCAVVVQELPDRVKVVIKSAGIASEGGTTKDYEYFETQAEGEAADYVGDVMTDAGEIQDTHDELKEAALEVKDEGKPKYRPVFMSSNAITLSHRIQVVLRFCGAPEEIHANYDFAHCTNYWTSWDSALVLRPEALEALLARQLRYIGSKYPICSVLRTRKFIQRGWRINAGQYLKMVLQISELDLKDYAVLEEQLTGVDVAYFAEVLSKVREQDPTKINSAYLIEILGRMF